ncbi:MAG: hypothetical protein COU11_04225 [Candidatus Harrisonbacteria bacterium CG10_big_fil_rev_8_21_14_0_10_49_15]|uniref:Type II secretion system protein GspG C-terminal domain-containing protein n=1 Tax=Candidatus Harrisonbacteria bacterium CG10_big_fil_rev_8_21_14_0_10_49_15 TaxID=1974587 RepID=A0A2H0UJV3_9BACT|nr:MAG: hypothetical protein COU11_04225 [Candidatus Harrisonbacteria bacterium CG10_big_fil_rev_8_21_14_0_10_49_15]
MKKYSKGFTLIELLITIGILAVLATVVVLVLNPAQLFAQARDTQRIADLGTTRSAINFYLSTATGATIEANGPFSTADATCVFGTCTLPTLANRYDVDGDGWVAVNLAATTGGSPLATLPQDPTNDATYQYAFEATTSTLHYEMDANMESTKYEAEEDNDGGSSGDYYEIGNLLTY